MNSDKLISIDDSDLETVAGGISLTLDVARGFGAGVKLDSKGVAGQVTLFGKNIQLGVGLGYITEIKLPFPGSISVG